MTTYLTHFYRESFPPDLCEEIGRVGLRLPSIAFGRTITMENGAFKESDYSLITRVAVVALMIISLPITALLAGIGCIGLALSTSYQTQLNEFVKQAPVKARSQPLNNLPTGANPAANNLPTRSTETPTGANLAANNLPTGSTETPAGEAIDNNLGLMIPKLDLTIPEGKITQGQGEYIVFHHLLNGETKKLEEGTFEKVYQILNEYTPAAIVNRGTFSTEGEKRYEIIQEKIKEIDSTLKIVFIPRTLYELIFVRALIQEDIDRRTICRNASSTTVGSLEDFGGNQEKYKNYLYKRVQRISAENCWHLAYFDEGTPCDNEHPGVIKAAYKLNQLALREFPIISDGFTFKEVIKLTEKEIGFLKQYYTECFEQVKAYQEKCRRDEKVADEDKPLICHQSRISGPSKDFGFEHYSGGACFPSGIRDQKDAGIVTMAVAIECSKAAQTSFCLFRGSKEKDFPYLDQNHVYSISYGLSLLAGCAYSRTALYFMRCRTFASITLVPFDQLNDSPFHIPLTNTVSQLFGSGDHYCSRSKVWDGCDSSKLRGKGVLFEDVDIQRLRSGLSEKDFLAQFQYYQDHRTFQLKT